ncbi:MAG TPA: hypothetical protein VMF91_01265, partial [Bryobacteraceae bacterium]|nr:hypothetical protein [Bryobacteraceae bacterium]
VWPLLTGERAHYELAAGSDVIPLIEAYEAFATSGQMLPEQVWDEADMPERSMRVGQPAGSAVPLVWAHAEYLKLLRSAVDGRVFDLIEPVYERYCEADGREQRRRGVEIYSRRRPIECMGEGKILRILDERRFDATWTDDGWQTIHTANSRTLGSAGYSADIAPAAGSCEVEWTLRWPEQDAWLGYNVKVKVDGP